MPDARRPVDFGDLRRVVPVERHFGFARGTPVDRYYIERFLARHALAIGGRVLEFGDATYTRRFGGARVTASDVWQAHEGAGGTMVGDLAQADHVAAAQFDCIICTQTLQYVFDLPAAVRTLCRLLRPGGTLLLTVPGISQIDDPQWKEAWCWGFTATSARKLFADAFGAERVEVATHGNVLSAVAFLHGLAVSELRRDELEAADPAYPLLVTVRATRPATLDFPSPRRLVSIVIPCFRQALFLDEAIESARAQTHAPIEIVVVDDGSPDNVAAIAARYPEVTYRRQENAGLAAARNAGIQASRGDYVVFLDADDRLLPNAVAEGVAHLEIRPECAFVSGHHRLIDVSGTVTDAWPRGRPAEDRYEALLRENYIGMGAAVLYRRTALDAVGGFDMSLAACEDYDLYFRLTSRFPVCDHDVVVAEYRKYGAAMTDNGPAMLAAVLQVMDRQRPLLDERPSYPAAFDDGVRHWREYYGAQGGGAGVRPGGAMSRIRRLAGGFARRTRHWMRRGVHVSG
jgi:SAM-dependent methyltransferase